MKLTKKANLLKGLKLFRQFPNPNLFLPLERRGIGGRTTKTPRTSRETLDFAFNPNSKRFEFVEVDGGSVWPVSDEETQDSDVETQSSEVPNGRTRSIVVLGPLQVAEHALDRALAILFPTGSTVIQAEGDPGLEDRDWIERGLRAALSRLDEKTVPKQAATEDYWIELARLLVGARRRYQDAPPTARAVGHAYLERGVAVPLELLPPVGTAIDEVVRKAEQILREAPAPNPSVLVAVALTGDFGIACIYFLDLLGIRDTERLPLRDLIPAIATAIQMGADPLAAIGVPVGLMLGALRTRIEGARAFREFRAQILKEYGESGDRKFMGAWGVAWGCLAMMATAFLLELLRKQGTVPEDEKGPEMSSPDDALLVARQGEKGANEVLDQLGDDGPDPNEPSDPPDTPETSNDSKPSDERPDPEGVRERDEELASMRRTWRAIRERHRRALLEAQGWDRFEVNLYLHWAGGIAYPGTGILQDLGRLLKRASVAIVSFLRFVFGV